MKHLIVTLMILFAFSLTNTGALAVVGGQNSPLLQTEQFTLNSKLLGSSTAKTANFGNDVDISGDTAVVGAWYDNIGKNIQQGAVYVYVRRSGFWVEQAKLVAADGDRREHFGVRVAIDGDTIVVGAPMNSTLKDNYKGAVYVF